jgi:murein DD-endopeptidase MepM/ murein hydrolase activator NlpD
MMDNFYYTFSQELAEKPHRKIHFTRWVIYSLLALAVVFNMQFSEKHLFGFEQAIAALPDIEDSYEDELIKYTGFLDAGIIFDEDVDNGIHSYIVQRGDSLIEILQKSAIIYSEAFEITKSIKTVFDPTDLRDGDEIIVIFDPDTMNFSALEIHPANSVDHFALYSHDGKLEAKKMVVPLSKETTYAATKIQGSFSLSAEKIGVPASIIAEMVKQFSYDVDFQRDVHPDDELEVVYEKYVTDDGRIGKSGKLKYARLGGKKHDRELYLHQHANGDFGYYDAKGKSIKKAFMRTPVDGARISSGYGLRRHPVLGYSKMHKGVDFAAPTGTPIYAAADGVVERVGPWGAYGNYMRIRHDGKYATAYAHISRFAKGMKNGKRVKQGQIIAYVGNTGRSTGPHLHYEVLVSGKQINPNSVILPTGNELAGAELRNFQANIAQMKEQIAKSIPNGDKIITSSN